MNILVISRDKRFIAKVRRLYNDGITTVMVISGVGFVIDPKWVPKEPDLVILDIAELKPGVWPKNVANLRKIFDWKVVVVDRRANCRRTIIAFKHYAVGYMSKAKRTTDAKIRKTVTEALRSGLPLLPSETHL